MDKEELLENKQNILLDDDIEKEIDPLSSVDEDDIKLKIYNIDLRIQEIDSKLEEYENVYFDKGIEILTSEEVLNLKEEYKNLRANLKVLRKSTSNRIWDKIPLWMFLYGVFQFILSSFLIMPVFTAHIAYYVKDLLGELLYTKFGAFVFIYGLTFINVIISLIIYILIIRYADKLKKNIFGVIVILQIVSSITTVIYLWDGFIGLISNI